MSGIEIVRLGIVESRLYLTAQDLDHDCWFNLVLSTDTVELVDWPHFYCTELKYHLKRRKETPLNAIRLREYNWMKFK